MFVIVLLFYTSSIFSSVHPITYHCYPQYFNAIFDNNLNQRITISQDNDVTFIQEVNSSLNQLTEMQLCQNTNFSKTTINIDIKSLHSQLKNQDIINLHYTPDTKDIFYAEDIIWFNERSKNLLTYYDISFIDKMKNTRWYNPFSFITAYRSMNLRQQASYKHYLTNHYNIKLKVFVPFITSLGLQDITKKWLSPHNRCRIAIIGAWISLFMSIVPWIKSLYKKTTKLENYTIHTKKENS